MLIIFLIAFNAGHSEEANKSSSFDENESGAFTFSFDNPSTKIEIPELPQVKMEIHPLSAQKPHLRYMGSGSGYKLSVITPTADAGMTAIECARTQTDDIIEKNGLQEGDYKLFKASDNHTFSLFYAKPINEFKGYAQLGGHLFSAAEGTHCVEVHISRITNSKQEIDSWYSGMPRARISTKN
jgi:hypothetical protein